MGSRSSTGGSIAPAMPFAASMTMRSGLSESTSTNESTRSTKRSQMSSDRVSPRVASRHAPAIARSRTSSRPESPPTGSAPRRTIFMPVYSFGLCEAVTAMPPSRPSSPTAK